MRIFLIDIKIKNKKRLNAVLKTIFVKVTLLKREIIDENK